MDIIFLSIQYCMTKQLFIFFMYCYFLVCNRYNCKKGIACMFKYSWNLNKVFESKRKRSWEKIEEIANTSSEEYAAKEIELCNEYVFCAFFSS